ncbi:MAG: acetyl-CoA hydrolase/transferase C-terminal domain-containing protein, partial [Patescibacteria group bacterium]
LGAVHHAAASGTLNPDNEVQREDLLGTGNPRSIRINGLFPPTGAILADPFATGLVDTRTVFVGSATRPAAQKGGVEFVPTDLGSLPRLIKNGRNPIDCVFVSVSPPDMNGVCTIGPGSGSTRKVLDIAIAQRERGEKKRIKVIAEVNNYVPRTSGDTMIHNKYFDAAVQADYPIGNPETPEKPLTPIESAIGKHVAKLVDNGATIQIGVGQIPNAILSQLTTKRGLHVFTEMFSSGIPPLVAAGVIEGPIKTSFAIGSQQFFDWIGQHPELVEFYGTEIMNDPFKIAQNEKMTAINAALEIDLTGQICADSIGTDIYSAAGGQYNFMQGATLSERGKAIVVLPSEINKGIIRKSKIAPTLQNGAGVVTPRNLAQWVVTEFGAINLEGMDLEQRALLLTAIAHPRYQPKLLAWANRFSRFKRPGIVDKNYIEKVWQNYVVKDENVDFAGLRR